MQAVWIKPDGGHIGNHVFVDGGDWAFDYHGYSAKPHFLAHVWRGARRRWPGWNGTLASLPRDVLISEQKSRTYDGLWLREPRQFLHDAMPRAYSYLDRFCEPPR
jgi:8-oxo-dGTP diphosphatase